MKEIDVQLGVTEIPSKAFTPLNGMQLSLTKITIRTIDVRIKKDAFYNLYNLKEININATKRYEYQGEFVLRKNLTGLIMYCQMNQQQACVKNEHYNSVLYKIILGYQFSSEVTTGYISYYKNIYGLITYNKLSKCKINDSLILDKI